MKTRSGENVPLRELLEEASKRALKIIEEKNPDLSKEERTTSRKDSASVP